MVTPPTEQINLNPAAVARALGGVAILLILANLVALLGAHLAGRTPHDIKLAYLFYLDGERNVPTAFSTGLLLIAAALLGLLTHLEKRRGAALLHWTVLTLGFLFMAIDEAWSFHEKLNAPVRALLGNEDLGAYFYAWVVPAMALVLVLGLFFARFLWRLPAATRLRFFVAGALFVGGALGVELLEGRFDAVHGDRNLVSGILATVQETLEMTGVIVFIWALLMHLAENFPALGLRMASTPMATREALRAAGSKLPAHPGERGTAA